MSYAQQQQQQQQQQLTWMTEDTDEAFENSPWNFHEALHLLPEETVMRFKELSKEAWNSLKAARADKQLKEEWGYMYWEFLLTKEEVVYAATSVLREYEEYMKGPRHVNGSHTLHQFVDVDYLGGYVEAGSTSYGLSFKDFIKAATAMGKTYDSKEEREEQYARYLEVLSRTRYFAQ